MDAAGRGACLELGPGSATNNKATDRAGEEEGVIRGWAAATSHPWMQGKGNSPPLPSPPSWLELACPLLSFSCCSLPQTSQGDPEKALVSQELRVLGSTNTTFSSQSEHHNLTTQTTTNSVSLGHPSLRQTGWGKHSCLCFTVVARIHSQGLHGCWKHTKVQIIIIKRKANLFKNTKPHNCLEGAPDRAGTRSLCSSYRRSAGDTGTPHRDSSTVPGTE